MNLRRLIVATLTAGAVLLLVLAAAGAMWGVLQLAGDVQGAAGAKGVTLVTAVLWCLDFVALVALLALAEIASGDGDGEQ